MRRLLKKIGFLVCLLFFAGCAQTPETNGVLIKNARNEGIYIQTDGLKNARNGKLAFIQHGLASNRNHPAVRVAKKAFLDNGYVVVSFDGRHSLGDGDDNVAKARLQTFEQDLETVVDWAKKQSFYSEPFALAGHSLGGASVIRFAEKHNDAVNVLIPVAPVVSGRSWEKSCMKNKPGFCRRWKQKGSYEHTDPNNRKTGVIPYAVVTSCMDYDAAASAKGFTAKTLLAAAENDAVIVPADVRELAEKMKNARIATVKSSGHNFTRKNNQDDLYRAINAFLKGD